MSEVHFTDKQTEILLVAEQLFAQKGFDGTSVRDISAHAGVNVAMVSYYFGSKEKLLEALVQFRISKLRLQIQDTALTQVPPREKMKAVIGHYLSNLSHNCNIYRIVQMEISKEKHSWSMELFNRMRSENLQVLQSIVEEGQKLGQFKPDVQVVLIPNLIVGSYMHLMMNRRYYQSILGLDDPGFEQYRTHTFTQHLQQTVLALLTTN